MYVQRYALAISYARICMLCANVRCNSVCSGSCNRNWTTYCWTAGSWGRDVNGGSSSWSDALCTRFALHTITVSVRCVTVCIYINVCDRVVVWRFLRFVPNTKRNVLYATLQTPYKRYNVSRIAVMMVGLAGCSQLVVVALHDYAEPRRLKCSNCVGMYREYILST